MVAFSETASLILVPVVLIVLALFMAVVMGKGL